MSWAVVLCGVPGIRGIVFARMWRIPGVRAAIVGALDALRDALR